MAQTISACLCALGLFFGCASNATAINVDITFNDPGGVYSQFHEVISDNMAGAAAAWGEFLVTDPNATIDVLIGFNDQQTASGGAGEYRFVETVGNRNFFEPGIVSELKTGIDFDVNLPDAEIDIGRTYLDILYFDPKPFERIDPVPSNRTDAISAFVHELGHVFGFNGWRDWATGEYFSDAGSTFDTFVEKQQGLYYFTGENATASYGGPVPLTDNNLYHVGNASPLPGDDLLDDVMNGVQSYFGRRENLTTLDFAILADLGFEVRSQERLLCDFVGASTCDSQDINELVSRIVARSNDLTFDLNDDGRVSLLDLDAWREVAGAENLAGRTPYPNGDINLDGQVGQNDQFIWSAFNFKTTGKWTQGDFNADGVTDGADFNIWNDHFEQTPATTIPEPNNLAFTLLLAWFSVVCAQRKNGEAPTIGQ